MLLVLVLLLVVARGVALITQWLRLLSAIVMIIVIPIGCIPCPTPVSSVAASLLTLPVRTAAAVTFRAPTPSAPATALFTAALVPGGIVASVHALVRCVSPVVAVVMARTAVLGRARRSTFSVARGPTR